MAAKKGKKTESTKQWTERELLEYNITHILKAGDDGIPNIRSADNALVDKIRQKPISSEFIQKVCDSDNIEETIREHYGEDAVRNYYRNRTLVDLDFIPKATHDSIITKYHESKRSGMQRNKFMSYLVSNRLALLAESIGEF